MPPKRQFSKEQIVDAAFDIVRGQGLKQLSARTLARTLGCSTSPIYSAFKSMQELEEAVCERGIEKMLEFQFKQYSDSPLVDVGLGYVLFAASETNLFRDLFLNRKEFSDHSRGLKDYAFERLMEQKVSQEPSLEGLGEAARAQLLAVIWTYTLGLATKATVGITEYNDKGQLAEHIREVMEPLAAGLKQKDPIEN